MQFCGFSVEQSLVRSHDHRAVHLLTLGLGCWLTRRSLSSKYECTVPECKHIIVLIPLKCAISSVGLMLVLILVLTRVRPTVLIHCRPGHHRSLCPASVPWIYKTSPLVLPLLKLLPARHDHQTLLNMRSSLANLLLATVALTAHHWKVAAQFNIIANASEFNLTSTSSVSST